MATFAFIASTKSVSLGASGGSTPAIDTTGATLIVVSIARYTVGTPNTFTDSAGNTWTNSGLVSDTAMEMEWWYVINPTTSATHTFTETGSNSFSTIIVSAYSGVAVVFDKKSSGAGNATSIQPGALTPTNGNSLVVTSTGADISETPSVDSGFTERETMPRNPGVEYAGGIADIMQGASPSSVNPAWSSASSGPRTAMAMVFSATTPPPSVERIPLVITEGVVQQLQGTDFLAGVVNSAADFTIDTALIIADGTGSKDVKESATITEANVTTVISDTATNVTNIATNVTNIATNVTNISTNTTDITNIQADYVSAAATFAVDNVVLRADGTSRGAQKTGVTIDDTDNIVGPGYLELSDMTSPGAPTAAIRMWSNSADFYVSADHVIIGDATGNTLAGTPVKAAFFGGSSNTITGGTNCTIVGGASGSITTSLYATVVGGQRNAISSGADYATALGGQDNTITGGWSTCAGGRQSECGGTYAMMIGFRGKTRLSGELGHSSGRHDTTNGSAQWSQFIVFNTTTNATGTLLYLDTGTAPITIPDNTSWIFDIDLLGMETDGTNTNAYNIKGAVRRDGTAVGAFVGTPTVTTLGEDDATWGVPTIAVPSNRMEITVNGLAATTINWTATVNVTQVIVES